MRRALVLGDDQRVQRLAQGLVRLPAEHRFGARIPVGDHAVRVQTDVGVVRVRDDRARARLAGLQRQRALLHALLQLGMGRGQGLLGLQQACQAARALVGALRRLAGQPQAVGHRAPHHQQHQRAKQRLEIAQATRLRQLRIQQRLLLHLHAQA